MASLFTPHTFYLVTEALDKDQVVYWKDNLTAHGARLVPEPAQADFVVTETLPPARLRTILGAVKCPIVSLGWVRSSVLSNRMLDITPYAIHVPSEIIDILSSDEEGQESRQHPQHDTPAAPTPPMDDDAPSVNDESASDLVLAEKQAPNKSKIPEIEVSRAKNDESEPLTMNAAGSEVASAPDTTNEAPKRSMPRQVKWDDLHSKFSRMAGSSQAASSARHALYESYLGAPKRGRKRKDTPSYETTNSDTTDDDHEPHRKKHVSFKDPVSAPASPLRGANATDPVILSSQSPPAAATIAEETTEMPPSVVKGDYDNDRASDADCESDSEDEDLPRPIVPPERRQTYVCEQPAPLKCPNQELVDIFRFLEHDRELSGKEKMMNTLAYSKAVAALKNYPTKITHIDQAKTIKGIGPKTSRMIADYLRTGKVQDVDEAKARPDTALMNLFYNIHGVGATKAREWISKGYKTLDDVQQHEKLSKDQKLGIKYYDEFLKRIPRSQVDIMVAEFDAVVKRVQPGCKYTVCGSYRRGKADSGDVDIVVTHEDNKVSQVLLETLVAQLQKEGLITDILSMSDTVVSNADPRDTLNNHNGQALCVWLSKHPDAEKIHHRFDIIVAPMVDYPLAVLGWTGSKYFERSLRLYSKQVYGIKVTSHGFYRGNKKLKVKSERHAFKLLGLKYLAPEMRNC
ncbi:hypothetical protein BC940DRAFT_302035 [Gongronella butleri]|nr:hypothetical protein BC940DRAFT_302035 [Gongronella butleri]